MSIYISRCPPQSKPNVCCSYNSNLTQYVTYSSQTVQRNNIKNPTSGLRHLTQYEQFVRNQHPSVMNEQSTVEPLALPPTIPRQPRWRLTAAAEEYCRDGAQVVLSFRGSSAAVRASASSSCHPSGSLQMCCL